jgi:hypothetical protein
MDKVICAWCENTAHIIPNDGNKLITHGICLYCAVKELLSIGINPDKYIKEYIQTLTKENGNE